ncbi:GLPGLI family protein [Myroides sp. LJL119]
MKFKQPLLCLLLFVTMCYSSSKQQNSTLLVEYLTYNNNQLNLEQNPIVLLSDPSSFYILTKGQLQKQDSSYPFLQTLVNWKENEILSLAFLNKQQTISTSLDNPYSDYQLHPQTKQIQGYTCKKATISVNSNTYTIWYTTQTQFKGGPNLIGANLGLVLELDRNGTQTIIANTISQSPKNDIPSLIDFNQITNVSKNEFDRKLHNSRFTRIELFENQIINFDPDLQQDQKVIRLAHGTVVVKKVSFPEIKPGSQIFLNVEQTSNGDAYDRTGSVFIIPTKKEINILDVLQNQELSNLPLYKDKNNKNYQGMILTSRYEPIVELMRFFTPFGIKHYNKIEFLENQWQEKATYKQDITEYATLLSNQEQYIAIFIGNYDKGGHKVSANIDIHPSMVNTTIFNTIIPLFNTTNVLEMAGQAYPTMFADPEGLQVEFELDKDLENAQLRFTTTGHGGWANGDEFNPKINSIYLNNVNLINYFPWRADCASYRSYNPVSGNFANGLSSSDLSRSNWCPGTITTPIWIPIGDLKKGKHKITLKIPMGLPEGNSQSFWCTSAVLFGS